MRRPPNYNSGSWCSDLTTNRPLRHPSLYCDSIRDVHREAVRRATEIEHIGARRQRRKEQPVTIRHRREGPRLGEDTVLVWYREVEDRRLDPDDGVE